MDGPGGDELLILCLSRDSGSELWRAQIDQGNELKRKQNNSSPSPVSDGKHVWAATGNGVVAAYTIDGRKLWQKDLQDLYGEFGLNWGFASSPLLYKGLLVFGVVRGQNTEAPGYVVAFDGATGEEIWKVDRPTDAPYESKDAYTTPIPVKVDGKTQIVVSGGAYVTSHDPSSGKEIWRSGGLNPENSRNYRIIASPVAAKGIVYAPSRKTPLLAIKADGKGDVTESHLVWKMEDRAGPDVPTPISDGTYFYVLNDFGQISCFNAETGANIWGPEETGIGRVSSSPLLAEGKLYLVSETAEVAVVQAGPKYKLLGVSSLDGSYTLSSPAAAGDQIFIRTGEHLYCLGKG
ncbi:MAG: PQQ-binding-like beta-propeller repeat protein [Verrucomicrobiota bacterium]|nr:PQQ-binding-like beta-propeller repeat protein [Verrucomicrobiota bacterium]